MQLTVQEHGLPTIQGWHHFQMHIHIPVKKTKKTAITLHLQWQDTYLAHSGTCHIMLSALMRIAVSLLYIVDHKVSNFYMHSWLRSMHVHLHDRLARLSR